MTTATPPFTSGDGALLEPSPDARAQTARSKSLELLGNLTMREIRGQYKRTTLGRLWSFINPLATIGIFSVVFATIMKIVPPPGLHSGIHAFAIFLGAALLPWNFINNGVMAGMNALVGNAGLLGKVYFPRWILVVSTVLSLAVTLCFELIVLIVVVAIIGGPKVLIFIPAIIVLVVLSTGFVTGVALMLSVLLVYFRDTQHFMALIMQIWFYMTPIVYPFTYVQKEQSDLAAKGLNVPLERLWTLNPAYRITESFRHVFYDYSWPSWQDWLGTFIWAVIALGAGVLVFRKFSARVVEEL